MGLDQYAYATTHGPGKWSAKHQLCTWRKHAALQGWMDRKYEEKNDTYEEFNCKRLYLDNWDLDELENAIVNRLLPDTEGFFFGNRNESDFFRERDINFISKARHHLNAGDKVYYYAWY